MKTIELKHWSDYLPYKVNFSHIISSGIETSVTSVRELLPEDVPFLIRDTGAKLILHPLSDLTKEIDINGNGEFTVVKDYISTSIKDSERNMMYLLKGNYDNFLHWKIERLRSLHFDLDGLIEKGFAINYNNVK